MKYWFAGLSLIILFGCDCGNHKEFTTIVRRHFNVKVVPDLSNRIVNKNYIQPDDLIVQQFADLIYPDIINNDSKINQYDVFTLDFINKKHINEYNVNPVIIDLKQFKNEQIKRNEYLGVFKDTSEFKKDRFLLVNTVKELSEKINKNNDHGADIYAYFKELNDIQIDTSTVDIVDTDSKDIIHNTNDNVIILLTDGYIETGVINDDQKMSSSLSADKIAKFRKDYISNGKPKGISLNDFFNQNGYGITPIKNSLLKNVRVLVLQLFDRGKTSAGNRNSEPTDIDIIKLFWNDWLIKSGVNQENIGLYTCYDTYDAVSTNDILKKFLKVK